MTSWFIEAGTGLEAQIDGLVFEILPYPRLRKNGHEAQRHQRGEEVIGARLDPVPVEKRGWLCHGILLLGKKAPNHLIERQKCKWEGYLNQ
jgi:hypothetical protein